MKFSIKKTFLGLTIAAVMAIPSFAMADPFHIAVASNFKECLADLIAEYGDSSITWHENASKTLMDEIIADSTEYQLFFSADQSRPATLASASRATEGTMYARGTLVAWSHDTSLTSSEAIKNLFNGNGSFISVAVADPSLAPYGLAAQQTMDAKGFYVDGVWDSRIKADYINITQTLNAAIAWPAANGKQVALVSNGQVQNIGGVFHKFDESLYSPIYQDACLIYQDGAGGSDINSDAEDFLDWVINNPDSQAIITGYNYSLNP